MGSEDYSVSRYLSYVRNRENHSNPGTGQKSIRDKTKTAAAYLYQADYNGQWSEVQFDFEEKIAQIIQLADWDLMISRPFAKYTISYLLNWQIEKLPKEAMISFDA